MVATYLLISSWFLVWRHSLRHWCSQAKHDVHRVFYFENRPDYLSFLCLTSCMTCSALSNFRLGVYSSGADQRAASKMHRSAPMWSQALTGVAAISSHVRGAAGKRRRCAHCNLAITHSPVGWAFAPLPGSNISLTRTIILKKLRYHT